MFRTHSVLALLVGLGGGDDDGRRPVASRGGGVHSGPTTGMGFVEHGQNNQQWSINSNGTITGVQSNLCLDANGRGTANGTKLILWACNGQTNQQWTLR